jgi:ankyrin repeat protein
MHGLLYDYWYKITTEGKEMTTISQGQIAAAFRHDHLDMVKWLLENGMDDINLLNFNDQMPLQAAIKNGNEDMAKRLKAFGRLA